MNVIIIIIIDVIIVVIATSTIIIGFTASTDCRLTSIHLRLLLPFNLSRDATGSQALIHSKVHYTTRWRYHRKQQ